MIRIQPLDAASPAGDAVRKWLWWLSDYGSEAPRAGGVHTRLPGCQLPTPHLCPLWPLGWPEGIQEWSQVGALRLLAALRGLWVDAEVEGLLTQVLALAQAQVQRQQGRPGRRGTPGRRTAAEKQQQVQQQEEEGGGAGGPHELWESLAGVEVLALESGAWPRLCCCP